MKKKPNKPLMGVIVMVLAFVYAYGIQQWSYVGIPLWVYESSFWVSILLINIGFGLIIWDTPLIQGHQKKTHNPS